MTESQPDAAAELVTAEAEVPKTPAMQTTSSSQHGAGSGGGGLLGKLRVLDAYPKINEDFFTKTLSGGIITIVSSVVMVLLFLSELREFIHLSMRMAYAL